jgi:hypothetical protein
MADVIMKWIRGTPTGHHSARSRDGVILKFRVIFLLRQGLRVKGHLGRLSSGIAMNNVPMVVQRTGRAPSMDREVHLLFTLWDKAPNEGAPLDHRRV